MSATKKPMSKASSFKGMLRNPFKRSSSPVRHTVSNSNISAISSVDAAPSAGATLMDTSPDSDVRQRSAGNIAY